MSYHTALLCFAQAWRCLPVVLADDTSMLVDPRLLRDRHAPYLGDPWPLFAPLQPYLCAHRPGGA